MNRYQNDSSGQTFLGLKDVRFSSVVGSSMLGRRLATLDTYAPPSMLDSTLLKP
jgi:hypothetical protein